MQEKNKLYKAYLKSKDPGALEKYKKYKNKLTAILHKYEKMYYTNLLEGEGWHQCSRSLDQLRRALPVSTCTFGETNDATC